MSLVIRLILIMGYVMWWPTAQAASFTVDGGAVTIDVPDSWKTLRGSKTTRAMIYAPQEDSSPYQSNIRIQRFGKPQYLTEASLEPWTRYLHSRLEKQDQIKLPILSKASLREEGSHRAAMVRLDYVKNRRKMARIYYLVSTAERSYLLSYTDLKKNMDSNPHLFKAAWNMITEVKLSSKPYSTRNTRFVVIGVVAMALILYAGFLYSQYRNRVAEVDRMIEGYNYGRPMPSRVVAPPMPAPSFTSQINPINISDAVVNDVVAGHSYSHTGQLVL